MKSLVGYILLYLKGMGMGGADVVPGVSGGTIAFITGIYQELLNSIKRIDLQALKLLRAFKIKEFWQYVNGTFLLVLVAGIATSVLSLAKLITYFLENYPIQVWSFFFGLIVISALIILREINNWSFSVVFTMLIGIAIAYLITAITPSETPDAPWFMFIAGAVAICAMILPGISGSFILLLFGKYEYVISALKDFRITDLIFLALGCLFGILSFARLVSWLFNKYHNLTVGFLSGFMIGSLNKVWPWKDTLETYVDRHGEIKPLFQVNILPNEYLARTGGEPFFLEAIAFAAFGFLLVLGIDRLASYLSTEK